MIIDIPGTVAFRDADGFTLVHYAAASFWEDEDHSIAIIDRIVELGVNPGLRNKRQESSVLIALRAGNSKLALHLLQKYGVLIGERIEEECHEALEGADWVFLRELLSRTKNNYSKDAWTRFLNDLLMYLCSIPKFWHYIMVSELVPKEGIQILAAFGADLHYHNGRNRTLLMASLKAGNADLALYLLNVSNFSIDLINKIDLDGETALSECIRSGHAQVFSRLLIHNLETEWKVNDFPISALQVACQSVRYSKSITMIHSLLQSKPGSLDIVDERGNTVLHYLAFGANGLSTKAAMQFILHNVGLNKELVNKQNLDGQSPLHFATFGGILENVAFLLQCGAKLGIADVRGYTPLHVATDDYGGNNYMILEFLLKYCGQSELDAKDEWGRTALMHAAGKMGPNSINASKNAVRLLLEKGASIKIGDNFGQTVSHHLLGRIADIEIELERRGLPVALYLSFMKHEYFKDFETLSGVSDYGGKTPGQFYDLKRYGKAAVDFSTLFWRWGRIVLSFMVCALTMLVLLYFLLSLVAIGLGKCHPGVVDVTGRFAEGILSFNVDVWSKSVFCVVSAYLLFGAGNLTFEQWVFKYNGATRYLLFHFHPWINFT